jgi:hypothetical protein
MTLWTHYPDGLPLVAEEKNYIYEAVALSHCPSIGKTKIRFQRAEVSAGKFLGEELVRDHSN